MFSKPLEILKRLLRPVPIGSVGWGPSTLLFAAVLTMGSYWALNTYLMNRVLYVVREDRPQQFQESFSADEFRRRVRQATNAPFALDKEPFASVFQSAPSKLPLPFSQLYFELVQRIIRGDRVVDNTETAKDTLIKETIEKHLSGNITGWRIYRLYTQPLSGQKLLDDLIKIEPSLQSRLAEIKDGDKYRDFLVKFAELAGQPAREPIRDLNRFNGIVQWLTVWLFWIILLILLRRVFYFLPLRKGGKLFDRASSFQTRENIQKYLPKTLFQNSGDTNNEFLDRVRSMEATTYRTIEFLISLLPSLGFVGTVIGMGDALLAADGLFSSRDKQQTITHITQQLGYAFDTTLIALIAALLAGVLVVICRIQENRVYTDIANQFFNPKPKR